MGGVRKKPSTIQLEKKSFLELAELVRHRLCIWQSDYYKNSGRHGNQTTARKLLAYICIMDIGCSITEVAYRMHKNHTSIMYYRDTFHNDINSYTMFHQAYIDVVEQWNGILDFKKLVNSDII